MVENVASLLDRLGVSAGDLRGGDLLIYSPIDGTRLAQVRRHTVSDAQVAVVQSVEAFKTWRVVPAPVRGELVRLLGHELRAVKQDLGRLVTIETGKILSEGLGEVQEMIDICDFAVGLSRQLYGLTLPSERPGHHMRELWHPLGPVGIITAFNFPVAVWAWNAALALVCGDTLIWKGSEKTPLCTLAVQAVFNRAVEQFKKAHPATPDNLSQILIGDRALGEALAESRSVPLVSATGSTVMGRAVGERVARRLGRSLLELGGNNAMVLAPTAERAMALRAILFSAVGTAGQRCTSLRRLFVHEEMAGKFLPSLTRAYNSLKVGDPLEEGTLVGPLIDQGAFEAMQVALDRAQAEGGTILIGGNRVQTGVPDKGYYARPALVQMPKQSLIVQSETFAPILYVMTYSSLDQAIEMHNAVPQGLSSCIFTSDVREAERFLSATGSDCGIANVNIGPSGAEIGGAFGGEKETGGGRESGSDAWKNYMRRQTQTVNYSDQLPLAQGVVFDV